MSEKENPHAGVDGCERVAEIMSEDADKLLAKLGCPSCVEQVGLTGP